MELSNGALIHYPTKVKQDADVTVTLTRPQLLNFVMNRNSDGLEMDGDASLLNKLVELLDAPTPDFAIVTPKLSSKKLLYFYYCLVITF
jgi:alkyl sulfatase BDS1-like metallo-beta-lactamase superfamily hydrolase